MPAQGLIEMWTWAIVCNFTVLKFVYMLFPVNKTNKLVPDKLRFILFLKGMLKYCNLGKRYIYVCWLCSGVVVVLFGLGWLLF